MAPQDLDAFYLEDWSQIVTSCLFFEELIGCLCVFYHSLIVRGIGSGDTPLFLSMVVGLLLRVVRVLIGFLHVTDRSSFLNSLFA